MKIVAFNGSPNGKNGNTETMVDEFFKGAEKHGASTEKIYLKDYKINHCAACLYCWVNNTGVCALKDDMSELFKKFLEADIAIFASPIYVDNVSGMMKVFMDRLFMPIEDPYFEKDENGELRHPRNFDNLPKIIAISNCGLPEKSNFKVLEVLFRRMARNFDLDLIAEIYCGGGGMLLQKGTPYESNLEKYKQALQIAGEEISTNLKLSNETKSKLNKSIIGSNNYVDQYVNMWDKHFDSVLDNIKK